MHIFFYIHFSKQKKFPLSLWVLFLLKSPPVKDDQRGSEAGAMPCEERLGEMGLFSWRRNGRWDLVVIIQWITGGYRKDKATSQGKVMGLTAKDTRRSKGHSSWTWGKKSLPARGAEHWGRLPREAVDLRPWRSSKLRWLRPWASWSSWEASPALSGGLDHLTCRAD